MADEALKAAIEARHGVRLPDELVDMWAKPESLIDDGPLVRLLGKIAPHRRSAWLPIVRAEASPPRGSRYGGAPWLADGEAWPECPMCKRPLHLFIQLASDDAPAAARELVGDGLVQLFYCAWGDTLCATGSDAWEPFATTVVARRVLPNGEGTVPLMPDFEPRVNAAPVVGWEEQADYPDPWELDALGIELDDEEDERTGDISDANDPGDKLGGWPSWIQYEDAPECPRCALQDAPRVPARDGEPPAPRLRRRGHQVPPALRRSSRRPGVLVAALRPSRARRALVPPAQASSSSSLWMSPVTSALCSPTYMLISLRTPKLGR